MKKNKTFKTILLLVAIGLVGVGLLALTQSTEAPTENETTEQPQSDAARFKADYSGVSGDNRFIYATNDEVLSLFENGTGLVFLGFPECPWCQSLSSIVDEAAKKEGLDKINYVDIREDRQSNSSIYQSLISILEPYLEKDEQEEPIIYVPDVTAVKDGTIVGRYKMEEASQEEMSSQSSYWTAERRERAVEQVQEMIKKSL